MPAVTTYHIRIKKPYATAILKDLQKLDAVELLPEAEAPIPEWQKKEVRKRIKEMQKMPWHMQIKLLTVLCSGS